MNLTPDQRLWVALASEYLGEAASESLCLLHHTRGRLAGQRLPWVERHQAEEREAFVKEVTGLLATAQWRDFGVLYGPVLYERLKAEVGD